jgi:hypothetical protein
VKQDKDVKILKAIRLLESLGYRVTKTNNIRLEITNVKKVGTGQKQKFEVSADLTYNKTTGKSSVQKFSMSEGDSLSITLQPVQVDFNSDL